MTPPGVPISMSAEPFEKSVAILGCGAVGSAFAAELAHSGAHLRLWSRSAERARSLAAALGSRASSVRATPDLAQALDAADVCLLCVTDDALAVCARLAADALPHVSGNPVALHTSGLLGVDRLAPMAEAGWSTGRLHPLIALPPRGARAGSSDPEGRPLRAGWLAISGDERARAVADELVRALAGRSLALGAGAALYHGAATLLAGGLVALFDTTRDLMAAADLDGAQPGDVEAGLLGLLRSVVTNLEERGATSALTGPAARGSIDSVTAHLQALRAIDPAAAALYRLLARRAVTMAEERGTIDADQRAALERVLSKECLAE